VKDLKKNFSSVLNNPASGWLIATIISLGYFFQIQFSNPVIIEYDAHFHIRYAQQIWGTGTLLPLSWLPFSILNDYPVDHHLLQHMLLIPFTFGDLILGSKISAALFASLMALAFYGVLRNQKVSYPLFWLVLLFASSSGFLFRMSMGRVQSLSLLMMMLAVILLLNRRHLALFTLSFLYVWLYLSAAVFLPLLALCFVLATWMIEHEIDWKILLAAFAGYAAGVVINPFFPADIGFLFYDILLKLKDFDVSVGGEWYPYRTWSFVTTSAVALACTLTGLLLPALTGHRWTGRTLFVFLVSLAFLFATMKSKRFIEYWPAFSVLFCAFSVKDCWQWTMLSGRPWFKPALVAALVFPLYMTYQNTVDDVTDTQLTNRYQGGASWAAENTEPGDMIFNSDWDLFPMLFFHAPKNSYVAGMDPAYLAEHDMSLYELWDDITDGEVNHPSQDILNRFGSRIVFATPDEEDFVDRLLDDPSATLQYKDAHSLVFSLNPS